MAYRAEFTIRRLGESGDSPLDRKNLLAEVRDYLQEEIQRESDSRVEVESETTDYHAHDNVDADDSGNKIRSLGGRLYSSVKDSLERRMRDRTSRANIESDMTDVYAFARIDAERYLDDGLWYLSVRLYSNDSELRAEVFFGAAREDETSSGPAPKFMRDLVERYDCRVGSYRVGFAATEGDLGELQFDPERAIPVLMVSGDAQGILPYGGIQTLSEQLLGMALVVEAPPEGSRRSEWGYQFDVWDGAARIIWPGARPHSLGDGEGGFYRPERRNFVSDVLYDLDRNALQDFFEREFTAVRAACMRSRRRQPLFRFRMGPFRGQEDYGRRAIVAESDQQWLERALSAEKVKRARADNLLETAQKEMERLREELAAASNVDAVSRSTETIRVLRRENKSLADELDKLHGTNRNLSDELRLARQRERIAPKDQNRAGSLIGDTTVNPGQLSLVGHGLNIMRDPVRRYIFERLAQAYNGREEARLALNQLGVDTSRASKIESALDYSNFDLVASHYTRLFGRNAHILSDRLRRIRVSRNRTIHPEFEENTSFLRSEAVLDDIAVVLRIVEDSLESELVTELKRALS